MIKALSTKLVNENQNDWNDRLSMVLFFHRTTFKTTIGYIHYQLMYGLHPLMLIAKYILFTFSGIDHGIQT